MLLGGALAAGVLAREGSILEFLDPVSLLMVVGASWGSFLCAHSFKNTFRDHDPSQEILGGVSLKVFVERLLELALASRKDGLAAIEGTFERLPSKITQSYFRKIIEGVESQWLKALIGAERKRMAMPAIQAKNSLDSFAQMVPVWGVVSALILVVNELLKSKGGDLDLPFFAKSFIPLIYSLIIAQVFLEPKKRRLDEKLTRAESAWAALELTLLCVAQGNSPKQLEDQLKAILSLEAA